MVNGGNVNNWICINFSRPVQDSVARGFCSELAQMCYISGMVRLLSFIFISTSQMFCYPVYKFAWNNLSLCLDASRYLNQNQYFPLLVPDLTRWIRF